VHKNSHTRASIVVFMFCLSTASTRSQDTVEASAGTRSLAPLPFQLVLPREHLLGDWYGTRTWLEDRGVTSTLTFVTDSLGNPGRRKGPGVHHSQQRGARSEFRFGKALRFRRRVALGFNVVPFRRQPVGELHPQRLHNSAGFWRRDFPAGQRGLPPETF